MQHANIRCPLLVPRWVADPATGNPVLLGSGHFANVYRGSYGMEPAAIKVVSVPALAMPAELCWCALAQVNLCVEAARQRCSEPSTCACSPPPPLQVIKEPGLLDRESLLREVAILKACRWGLGGVGWGKGGSWKGLSPGGLCRNSWAGMPL